jgi:hypothetical protein
VTHLHHRRPGGDTPANEAVCIKNPVSVRHAKPESPTGVDAHVEEELKEEKGRDAGLHVVDAPALDQLDRVRQEKQRVEDYVRPKADGRSHMGHMSGREPLVFQDGGDPFSTAPKTLSKNLACPKHGTLVAQRGGQDDLWQHSIWERIEKIAARIRVHPVRTPPLPFRGRPPCKLGEPQTQL